MKNLLKSVVIKSLLGLTSALSSCIPLDFFQEEKGTLIVATQGYLDENSSIESKNLETNENKDIGKAFLLRLKFSPDYRNLIYPTNFKESNLFSILDNTTETRPIPLNLFPEPISFFDRNEDYFWSENNPSEIVYSIYPNNVSGGIYLFNLNDSSNKKLVDAYVDYRRSPVIFTKKEKLTPFDYKIQDGEIVINEELVDKIAYALHELQEKFKIYMFDKNNPPKEHDRGEELCEGTADFYKPLILDVLSDNFLILSKNNQENGNISLLDINSKTLEQKVSDNKTIERVKLSPDKKILAYLSKSEISVLYTDDWKPYTIKRVDNEEEFNEEAFQDIAFNPESSKLAYISNRKVSIINLALPVMEKEVKKINFINQSGKLDWIPNKTE